MCPSLAPEEFQAGRAVTRGDEEFDVLDTVTGESGAKFVIVTNDSMDGAARILPVALLREEESDFTSVDQEEREANRQAAEAERAERDRAEQAEFQAWQQQQQRDRQEYAQYQQRTAANPAEAEAERQGGYDPATPENPNQETAPPPPSA